MLGKFDEYSHDGVGLDEKSETFVCVGVAVEPHAEKLDVLS